MHPLKSSWSGSPEEKWRQMAAEKGDGNGFSRTPLSTSAICTGTAPLCAASLMVDGQGGVSNIYECRVALTP